MKTYVITLAKTFMANHPKAGQLTCFNYKIAKGEKLHTLRGNYKLWEKRISEINAGNAVLSMREWISKPYRSTQRELQVFRKVGIQKLQLDANLGVFIDDMDSNLSLQVLANNDGLTLEDFKDWFKNAMKQIFEPIAVIHFTDFRY